MTNPTQVAPFAWGDVSLSEVVHLNGIPHATKRAIGEWLEYADPRVGINGVLHANPYIEEFSVDVKLTSTDGKNYDTRVYHPMGVLLLVMESGQPQAQQHKIALAAFVFHFCGARPLPPREVQALRGQLFKALASLQTCRCAFTRELLLGQITDLCRQLGQPIPDLHLIGKDPKQTALEGF